MKIRISYILFSLLVVMVLAGCANKSEGITETETQKVDISIGSLIESFISLTEQMDKSKLSEEDLAVLAEIEDVESKNNWVCIYERAELLGLVNSSESMVEEDRFIDLVFDNRVNGIEGILNKALELQKYPNRITDEEVVFDMKSTAEISEFHVNLKEETAYFTYLSDYEANCMITNVLYGPDKKYAPDIRFYAEEIDKTKLSEEQVKALDTLSKEEEVHGGIFPYKKALVLGKIEKQAERLSLDKAKTIIEEFKDYDKIIDKFSRIQPLYDYSGGSGITQIIYFCNEVTEFYGDNIDAINSERIVISPESKTIRYINGDEIIELL